MIAFLANLGRRVQVWLALAAGAVLAVLAAYVAGRSNGASTARTDAQEADNDRARAIEDAADMARAGGAAGPDALERLRAANRIRD